MRPAGLVLAVVSLASCSSAGTMPAAPTQDVRLANAAGAPFAFFAIAADLEPVFDPVIEVRVDEPGTRLVQPGEEQALGDVPGRADAPQGGIMVYLYALTADGLHARLTRTQLTSGEDIRRAGGRIVIRRLR